MLNFLLLHSFLFVVLVLFVSAFSTDNMRDDVTQVVYDLLQDMKDRVVCDLNHSQQVCNKGNSCKVSPRVHPCDTGCKIRVSPVKSVKSVKPAGVFVSGAERKIRIYGPQQQAVSSVEVEASTLPSTVEAVADDILTLQGECIVQLKYNYCTDFKCLNCMAQQNVGHTVPGIYIQVVSYASISTEFVCSLSGAYLRPFRYSS